MIESKNRLSLAFGVPGILIEIGCAVFLLIHGPFDTTEPMTVFILVGGMAHVMILVGVAFYAESRGHGALWCLLGLVGLPGLIGLIFLPDRYKPDHPPAISSRLPDSTAIMYSQLATFSMILGIISLCLIVLCFPASWIVAIPAIITGRKAKREIEASHGAILGDSKVRAGLITGYLGLILGLVIVLGYVVLFITLWLNEPPSQPKRSPQLASSIVSGKPTQPRVATQPPPEPRSFLPAGARIVTAEYGPPTNADARVDVTERVRLLVAHGSFVVTNDAMGGDPVVGVRKQLFITCETDEGRATLVFWEDTAVGVY